MDKNKKQEIFEDAIKNLSPYQILSSARRNEERPFGMVIDYLKDCYSLPKSEGWDIAEDILKHFNIENYEKVTLEIVFSVM